MNKCRPLKIKNLKKAADIHNLCLYDSWSLRLFREVFSDKTTGSFGFFDPDLKGFLVYRLIDDELEILTLVVHPHHQNQGIGKLLLDHLFHLQIKTIFLEVREKNTKAVQFYFKKKFEKYNVRKDYYLNESKERENALLLKYEFS